jgi:hypothetical protein
MGGSNGKKQALEAKAMSPLAYVLTFKIAGTLLFWCVPLLFFPAWLLESIGLPQQGSYMFIRMLGWAYLALCVGYGFALKAALAGMRLMGPIWVGMVSNGGACLYLLYYGVTGEWTDWSGAVQFILWGSTLATGLITLGLYCYGVRGSEPVANGIR